MPEGPYPVLILTGEQGSAKSTLTRVLRRLIDPHEREMRSPPKDIRDFVTMVKHTFVLAFDNVSSLSGELSDTLCRLSTGHGAIGGRALYTDADEAGFKAVRPVILNGITDFVMRPDLIDRALRVHLPAIEPEHRLDDETFWTAFNGALPQILGALYDAVAAAHAGYESVVIPPEKTIRLASFMKWAVAAEPAMSFQSGSLIEALNSNWAQAADYILEYDTVATALVSYLSANAPFHGTLQQLLAGLTPFRMMNDDTWPRTPRGLSNVLKRLAPVLRKKGIEIYNNGRQGHYNKIMYEIRIMEIGGNA